MMFAVLLSYTIQAQTIKGKVTAEDGKPVAGATIKVKGSNVGTVANNDGEYTLSNVAKNTVFVISSIGYLPAEINIGTRTFVEIVLSADTRELGEVIVVGYGTQKKRDITGAVVSVSEKTLKEVPAPNLLNSLKGRAAGVSIVSNGSTPGSQASIRVRGNRSLTTGSGDGLDGPLVVVDGIPFGGLNDINPDDISNIEILKDASATAIYGSRGAGGVILVTTKRGKVGKPIFSYDGYHGITSMMGKYNVMNGEQYAKFKDLSAAYNTQGAGTTAYPLTEEEKANLAAGVSTDWQSLLYKPGLTVAINLDYKGR
jgi:TonB-dependent SusC/RagA subfamily outer membrane receptor